MTIPYLCEFGSSGGVRVQWTYFQFFSSVDHNDIFDHKYFIDPGNLLII